MQSDQVRDAARSLTNFGLLIFVIGVVGGVIVGNVIGATVTNGGAIQFLTAPSHGLEKRFNWVLFILIAAPAVSVSFLLFGLGSALRSFTSQASVPADPGPYENDD